MMRSGANPVNAPSLPIFAAVRVALPKQGTPYPVSYTVGSTFAFRRNRFVGSYRFFTATSRA